MFGVMFNKTQFTNIHLNIYIYIIWKFQLQQQLQVSWNSKRVPVLNMKHRITVNQGIRGDAYGFWKKATSNYHMVPIQFSLVKWHNTAININWVTIHPKSPYGPTFFKRRNRRRNRPHRWSWCYLWTRWHPTSDWPWRPQSATPGSLFREDNPSRVFTWGQGHVFMGYSQRSNIYGDFFARVE